MRLIRLLSTLTAKSEEREDSTRKIEVYTTHIHEDSSTTATKLLTSTVEWGMKSIVHLLLFLSVLTLGACVHKGSNPADPYESINRETHKFNMAFDATVLKPPARLYKAITPPAMQKGIANFYDNLQMLPAVASDLLQADWRYAIKDSSRFVINTTLGIGGLIDVATRVNIPPHHNDLGLTFAKWGDKNSPYLVIPFLGPSTIRDGMGMLFDYSIFSIYAYIPSDAVIFSLLGVDYIQTRAKLLEIEPLINEALDQYSFIRDAYLQHRQALISGALEEGSSDPIDSVGTDYIEE